MQNYISISILAIGGQPKTGVFLCQPPLFGNFQANTSNNLAHLPVATTMGT